MYIVTNESTGRLIASSVDSRLSCGVELDEPDGWDAERQHDWRLSDGTLVYDPLPVEPPLPSLQEQVDALSASMLDLILGGAV